MMMNLKKQITAMRLFVCLVALWTVFPAAAVADFAPVRRMLRHATTTGVVAGGSILVLHHGEVVLGEGFGFADVVSKSPFTLDTPVVIASISKPLLGTAAFHLAENGKVNLTLPISESLPEFNNAKLESGEALVRAPNLIELFTHTSGMRNDDATGGRPWFASWTDGKSLEDVVKKYARDFPFQAQPGRRYAYSGIGTDVAARVLEVASKQSRNELFIAEVAKPLGMSRTRYRDTESIKHIGHMPTRYYRGKDGSLLVSRERPLPSPTTYCSSGGTIISTAPDLARWLMMIRNNGKHEDHAYLTADSMTAMLASVPLSSRARGGLSIRKKDSKGKVLVVGHSGSSGTNCWIDFEHDIIGIVLTQTSGKQMDAFRNELEKLVSECIAKQPSKETHKVER